MSRNPSHRIYERRWKDTKRHLELGARVGSGMYPCAIVWWDRWRQVAGDYARLAMLPFRSGVLEFEKDCPRWARETIAEDARRYPIGSTVQVSTAGQTVMMGYERKATT